MIYADNAATTQLAPEALARMMPYLQVEYGNASQPYSFSRTAKSALKEARETIALMLIRKKFILLLAELKVITGH